PSPRPGATLISPGTGRFSRRADHDGARGGQRTPRTGPAAAPAGPDSGAACYSRSARIEVLWELRMVATTNSSTTRTTSSHREGGIHPNSRVRTPSVTPPLLTPKAAENIAPENAPISAKRYHRHAMTMAMTNNTRANEIVM